VSEVQLHAERVGLIEPGPADLHDHEHSQKRMVVVIEIEKH
jgi:hypothetical protein